MSRLPALFSATILLSISACQSVNQHAAEPSAVEPAVQPVVRPTRATDVAASETPVTASVSTEAAAPKPAAEVKPAVPAIPAAAKGEAPVAAKAAGLGKEQALALATKGNCLVCHKIDSKLVGPAWKDVGAKYKGDDSSRG